MAGLLDVLNTDEVRRFFEELTREVKEQSRRMELLELILGPKHEDRMFRKPFQSKTLAPTTEGEVYRQDIEDGFIGVITRIGNDWFPNTVLTRIVDQVAVEPKIERVIAPTDNPIAVKIFVRDHVIWRAQNNDGMNHTFGILTDGFLIPRTKYEEIVAIEG